MAITLEYIKVSVVPSEDDIRRTVIKVQAYSRVKKNGLKASTDIDPGEASSQQHLLQLIGIAGAACAEHLGEKYGDNIDPAKAAQNAIRAFGEECRLIAALNKDVKSKVQRLKTFVFKLSNQDQEIFGKLCWLFDKQQQLTISHIKWLDKQLSLIHGSQLQ